MKTAIIGSGSIVPDFIEAAKQIPELELYLLFGRKSSAEKLKNLQQKWGVEKLSLDYEEVLADPQVEAVYIALPNDLHYTYAKQALEAKKHVILEKPFANNLEEGEDLFAVAEQNRVMIFEAISTVYLPNFLKTKEVLKEIGNTRLVQMNFSKYSRRYDNFKKGEIHPVFDPKKSGGALMDLGVYNLHFITGLFGEPQDAVYYANVEKGIDTSGMMVLTYPAFQAVSIAAKDCSAPLTISLQGDNGFLHSTSPSNAYREFTLKPNDREAVSYAENGDRPRLYYELETFVRILKEKDSAAYRETAAHTLLVQKLLDLGRRCAGIEIL